jgi:hypothetical protein
LPVVSLQQGLDLAADVGAEPDPILGMSTGQGLVVIAYLGLAVCLVAVVSITIRRELRARGKLAWDSSASTDPEEAGILAVALVRQAHAERWVPAVVVRLCMRGVLTLVDEGISHRSSRRTTYLECSTDPEPLRAQAAAGDVDAAVACALFGARLDRGERVPAARARAMTRPMFDVAERALVRAREAYADRSNTWLRGWLIATAVTGVVAGTLAVATGPRAAETFVVAAATAVLAIGAFLARRAVPSVSTLNPTGCELRENSRPEVLAPADVTTRAEGERAAPWAVLFNRYAPLERFAKISAQTGSPPDWYRWDGDFTASRLVGCVRSLESAFVVSAAAGAAVLSSASQGEHLAYNLGLLQGWSDAGGGGGGDGGGGFDGGGGGGFDGGGGGGFDGGGGGGGDCGG